MGLPKTNTEKDSKAVLTDISKLLTFRSYAKLIGRSRQDIYYLYKKKQINVVDIDGFLFVDMTV